jgi:hypothetical protein
MICNQTTSIFKIETFFNLLLIFFNIQLQKESEEYLNEKGEYASPNGVEPIGKNKDLGNFLQDIDEMAKSLAEPFERPNLSMFGLMVSIVGVPNAGIITWL